MASMHIKKYSRIISRGVLQIIRNGTDFLSRGASGNFQRHLHADVSVRDVNKLGGCLLSGRYGVLVCRHGLTSECRGVTMLGMCQLRRYSCTSEVEPLDMKPTRLLSGKLNTGKKRGRTQEVRDDLNAAAYMVGDSINLRKLKLLLREEGLYEIVSLPGDVKNAVMATAIYKVDTRVREIFFFSDGRVACWNMPENERIEMLKTVLKCTVKPFSLEAVLEEEELQPVTYHRETKFANSTIHLKTLEENQPEEELILQKFAFSDAMGQTVMLAFCERKLDAFTDRIEPEIQKLQKGIPSRMVMADINKNRGEVFLLRHEINLESDLLDTPDLYWQREELEGLYKVMLDYYSIRLRIIVFNERLDFCSDFLELLNNQANDAKHVFLEKVIILLIMIEVVFGGVPFLQEYLPLLFSLGQSDAVQQASELTEIAMQQASDATQITETAQIADSTKTKLT